MRIQFICKKNETYGFTSYTRRSSGLYNSTRFIVESLAARGVHAEIVEVQDNNDIDRNVSRFRPDIVVLEALWVVPSKFPVLKKLHPKVKWYVHLHSHIPFLALEGIAMEWIDEYDKLGVGLIANSVASFKALKGAYPSADIIYLPNIYLPNFRRPKHPRPSGVEITCMTQNGLVTFEDALHVGCFGAIRPLKNQLLQAMAALKFAKEEGKFLCFHINSSRTETMGEPVLKNLVELFNRHKHCAELVRHEWHEPEQFLHELEMKIDIGMQVSLTETFNVVTADYVTAGLPVVVSKEVLWCNPWSKAQDDSIDDIVNQMRRALHCRWLIKWNQYRLQKHSKDAQERWFKFVEHHSRVLSFAKIGIKLNNF